MLKKQNWILPTCDSFGLIVSHIDQNVEKVLVYRSKLKLYSLVSTTLIWICLLELFYILIILWTILMNLFQEAHILAWV